MSVPEPPGYGGIPQWPFSPPEAIAWGWRKFAQFLGPVMIAVAIYIAFTAATSLPSGGLSVVLQTIGEGADNDVPFLIADAANQFVFQVVATIGGFILGGAAARAALDVADGRQYDFLNAIRRIPIGKLIGSQLLIGAAVVVVLGLVVMLGVLAGVLLHLPFWILAVLGIFVVAVPCLAVAVFVHFTRWFLVDEPTTGVVDAIRASARLARANLGNTVLLLTLNLLVLLAGLLACGIGLVVAYPVTYFATANAYRRFRGQFVAA